MTSLLRTQTEIKFIAKRDGKSRLLEACNKITVYSLPSKIKAAKEPKAMETYAASPVVTKEQALSFLPHLTSSRSQRLQKRKISAITTPSAHDEKLSKPSRKKARETPELPYITNSISAPYSPVVMKPLEDIIKSETIISPLFGAHQ